MNSKVLQMNKAIKDFRDYFSSLTPNVLFKDMNQVNDFETIEIGDILMKKIPIFGTRIAQFKASFEAGKGLDQLIFDCRVIGYIENGMFEMNDGRKKSLGDSFIFNGQVPQSIKAITEGNIYFQFIPYSNK